MGSEREGEIDVDRGEDKKRESDERAAEPSQFRVANLHPMPRPLGRNEKLLTWPEQHSDYRAGHRQADEEPVNWTTYVVAKDPGAIMPEVKLAPGPEPEAPNRNQDKLDPAMRDASWRAYTATSLRLEDHHRDLANDHAAFMQAEDSADLQALGFVKPSRGWTGTASGMADHQRLVDEVRLGSLFRANGALNLTRADAAGIATAHEAFEAHGTAKQEHDDTIGQDHALLAARFGFDAAVSSVQASFDTLEAAKVHIEAVSLQHEVDEDREALNGLRGRAEKLTSFLELTFGGLLKYTVTGPEEAADAVESLGVMASYAVSLVSENSIRSAEEKLKEDTTKLSKAQLEEARLMFNAARERSLVSVGHLRSARHALLEAMNNRQKVFTIAGKASASASGGNAATQARIASIMTAIPAVETVLGWLRKLDTKIAAARVPYAEDAGVGFSMALYAGRAQASDFVGSLGRIEYLREMFADATLEWRGRLEGLQQVRSQIGGERAGTQ